MKFFTKSNLISIATLALVCIPSAAVSAANFKPSQTSEYSTLEMVNNQPVARLRPIKIHKSSSNEIEIDNIHVMSRCLKVLGDTNPPSHRLITSRLLAES
jgi:hypothetical protein